jgi:hypothetical protein
VATQVRLRCEVFLTCSAALLHVRALARPGATYAPDVVGRNGSSIACKEVPGVMMMMMDSQGRRGVMLLTPLLCDVMLILQSEGRSEGLKR